MPSAESLLQRYRAGKGELKKPSILAKLLKKYQGEPGEGLGSDLSIWGEELLGLLRENPAALPVKVKQVVELLKDFSKAKEATGAMLAKYPSLAKHLETFVDLNRVSHYGAYVPLRGHWVIPGEKSPGIRFNRDLIRMMKTTDPEAPHNTMLHELGHAATDIVYPTIFEKYYKPTAFPERTGGLEKLADAIARVEARSQGLPIGASQYSGLLTSKALSQWDWHAEMLLADLLKKGRY